MIPHDTQYWVVVFQPTEEAIEPLGSVLIGVNFSTVSHTLNHPISYFSYPFASSDLPVTASYQTIVR